jgi:glycosyltransferase involved in cell wall biosynthesis/peptidoglycan/xylan/chitin deacetylase (PgdA/CDA1 family)
MYSPGPRPLDEPVEVLHVGADMAGRGGVPTVLRELFGSRLAEDHRLSFVSTYAAGQPLRVQPLRQVRVFPVALLRIARWCARPGRRVVHIHTAVRGSWYRKAACAMLVKAMRRPVVLQFHSGGVDIGRFWAALDPFSRAIIGAAFRRVDQVLTVSAAGAEVIHREMAIEGVRVIPNPAPAVPEDHTRLPAADVPPEVLYLGGFANPAKGGRVLLDAVGRLPADPGFELVLAGPGALPTGDGDLLRGRGHMRWAGWLEAGEKLSALQAADVVVLPSISEGLPIALLEAMAHGRAVVAARTGGIPELVTDGENGVLVDAGDAAGLAEALVALAADRPRRERLGRAARQRVERLNGEEVFGRLDTLYRDLAGAAGGRPAGAGRRVARRRRDLPEQVLGNRARNAVFLCYHSVADDGPPWSSIPTQMFERHLSTLSRLGYRAGRRSDLADLLAGRRPRQPLAFLTFDDGFRDNHDTVLPVLRDAGWTGLVFLLPPSVDSGGALDWPEVAERRQAHPEVMRSLTWPQVEEMTEAGMEFGSHTNRHPLLPELGDEELREELLDSRRRVAERLGGCDTLAYPFGAWSARVQAAAADAGYVYGFTLPDHHQRSTSPLTIPRLVVDHRDEPWRFALKVQAPARRLWFGPARPAVRAALRPGSPLPHGREWR